MDFPADIMASMKYTITYSRTPHFSV